MGHKSLPSEDTVTLVLPALLFTEKVSSARDGQDARLALLSQVKGISFMKLAASGNSRRKPEANIRREPRRCRMLAIMMA
jgi:hypothetical protein